MAYMRKTTMALALVLAGMGAAEAATYSVIGGSLTISGAPATGAMADMNGKQIIYTSGGSLIEGAYQGYSTTPVIFPDAKLPGNDGYFITFTEGPNAAPSIDWKAMTADLRSFNASWGGFDYAQGAYANISSLGGGNYRLIWSAPFSVPGAELDGYTGNWVMNISGGPTPVPVPASLWLLGSGLVGLAGVSRRKLAA